jgi:hypothetical protein
MYLRTHEALGQLPTSYFYDSPMNAVGGYTLLSDVTPPSGPITVAGLAGSLTNLVFWARHRSLEGQPLRPNTKEAAEWSQILKDEVRPALHNSSTQRRIVQLIFFSRHPAVLGHFKDQPQDKQQKLSKEFDDIRKNIVQPWLALQLARGQVNSRTIFVVDNNPFKSLPWETRTRAGDEIASQFAFVNGRTPITVIFLDPARFPAAFNFSDAVVSVTDLTPKDHVHVALSQQVKNLNHAIDALGSRLKFPAPGREGLNPETYGLAFMNKVVTLGAHRTQVAAPLMASAVNLNDLIDYVNDEAIPNEFVKVEGRTKDSKRKKIPKDKALWDDLQREIVGIALGRAMAHEVRHLYVRNGVHAADGLGSDGARLFGRDLTRDLITFSAADKTNIQSSITTLERQQSTRAVAASFAAAERSFDFPF